MKKFKTLAIVLAVSMLASIGLTACGKKDNTTTATYTYRGSASTLPTNWNTHTYQANDAITILGYTEDGFYTFDYNEAKDGYKIVPSMAVDFPVDVTANYVGETWGIEEGETGRVYRIQLRDDLKFDNGDEIHAVDFVESVKRLLDPELVNYRADSLYSGSFKMYNAENYFYSGRTVLLDSTKTYTEFESADKSKLVFSITNGESYVGTWLATNYGSYAPAYALGVLSGAGEEGVEALVGKTCEEIFANAELKASWDKVIGWWQTDPNEELHFFGVWGTKPVYTFDQVGIWADPSDKNGLYFVLEQKLTGFYLHYSLTGSFSLVHTKTYDKCITVNAGVKSCTYATTANSYVGYGAYKLASYIPDNVITFTKNAFWYGYNDEANKDLYQTTAIEIKCITDESQRLNEFLAGNLDSYGLLAADMEEYQGSQHTYYTEGDSTWFVALNPHFENLKANQELAEPVTVGNEVNKTILTVKEFRQALSFSIDRAAYALALDPLGGTAKALYGNMIVSDPESGTAYRTTEQAKDTILKFWGLYDQVGEGKLYADKDEAIASITGYDLAGAKKLFDQAYDIAVADGLISADAAASGNFEIHIRIGQPGSGSSAYYNNGYELLKKVWTDAVVGTKLEGKLVFTQSEPLGSSGFANYLRDNSVDVLFGVGWTGSALDPFGLMEAYVAPNYQYDPAWDTKATSLDIEIDGKVLRASVYDWGCSALAGDEISATVVVDGEETDETVTLSAGPNDDATLRLNILAAVECAVLERYDMIPINLDCSANLKGMKIIYGTEEYVYGVGRGGVKYMTYAYSDAEWIEFVKENAVNNQLNYK